MPFRQKYSLSISDIHTFILRELSNLIFNYLCVFSFLFNYNIKIVFELNLEFNLVFVVLQNIRFVVVVIYYFLIIYLQNIYTISTKNMCTSLIAVLHFLFQLALQRAFYNPLSIL